MSVRDEGYFRNALNLIPMYLFKPRYNIDINMFKITMKSHPR